MAIDGLLDYAITIALARAVLKLRRFVVGEAYGGV